MAKKSVNRFDQEVDEDAVDKKTRRKAKSVKSQSNPADEDAMSRIVGFCQENRWREAVLHCRLEQAKAKAEGNDELSFSLSLALPKLEWSLRRQMAMNFIIEARELLKKEYLLDVGQ